MGDVRRAAGRVRNGRRDPLVRVLILRGAGGKAFVSGTDISQFQSFREPKDAIDYEKKISLVLGRLERVTKPTITQVEGFATGAGCGIVATCDLSIATTDSAIGIPIARTLGNVASSGTFARIVNLIGPSRAKEMIFTGRLIPAPEAQAIGLINRVVAKESIESEVMALATQIASNAPLTIRATKEMTRRLMDARQPRAGRRGSDRDAPHERRLQGRGRCVPVQAQAPVDGRVAG